MISYIAIVAGILLGLSMVLAYLDSIVDDLHNIDEEDL